MALTRSPKKKDSRDNSQRQNENALDANQAQSANNNDNGNNNNDNVENNENEEDNQIIDIVDDTFREFVQPVIPRSTIYDQTQDDTPPIPPNNQTNNNQNVENQSGSQVNNPQIKEIIPQSTNSAKSAVPNTSSNNCSIKCVVCSQDASKHRFNCIGCGQYCHPVCLLDSERESVELMTTSYTCNRCERIAQNLSSQKLHTPKLNNIPKSINMPQPHVETQRVAKNTISYSPEDNNKNLEPNSQNFTMNSLMNGSTELFLYKMQLRQLPEVQKDSDWVTFYATYKETKDLFTDHQNVIRLQAAIKHAKVKQIGGAGLFDLRTYHECIENVNSRLKHNFDFLLTESQALETHPKIKADNKVKLVEFIDRVRNFVIMSIANQDYSYMTNKRFLANVADVIPPYLRNKWEAKQAVLEEIGQIPSLEHMKQTLDSELPRIEASIRNDRVRNTSLHSENKSSHENSQYSHDKSRKFRMNHLKSSHESNSHFPNNNQYEKHEHKLNGCWLHKTNDHSSYKCKTLWELDGKTVSILAKSHLICTFCGQSMNDSHLPCKNNANLTCKMPGCTYKHHDMFCFKRKGKMRRNSHENYSQSCENHNQSGSSMQKSFSKESVPKNGVNTLNTATEASENEEEIEKLLSRINEHNYYTNIPSTSFHGHLTGNSLMNTNVENNLSTNSKDSHLLGVLVVRIENQRDIALLIDTGSTVSLIEENIANDLNLRGPLRPLTLTWSGNQQRQDNRSRIVKAKACKVEDSSKSYNLCFRTVKNLNVCAQQLNVDRFLSAHPNFQYLKLHSYNKIDGILGIDNPLVFRQIQSIQSVDREGKEYHGISVELGDYVYGVDKPLCNLYEDLYDKKITVSKNAINAHNVLSPEEQNELEEMEKEIMGMGYHTPLEHDTRIADEKEIFELLDERVKRVENDTHFVAPLLWKEKSVKLPTEESFKMSLRRYFIVEKQAYKLNQFQECANQIKNLLEKDYAVELTPEEIKKPHAKSYYNPIFFISPATKRTRLIWDLAAKIDGRSLNDYLMAGPNLYNNLLDIMFKMREGGHFAKGDISEMFHQIKVDEDDSNALRFLFRFSPNEKIRVFKMKVLPFGAACSPVLSQYVKNRVALEHEFSHPNASKAILNNSYVDDIIKSEDDPEKLITQVVEMRKILATGGFNFLKINSNSKYVLTEIESQLSLPENSHEKVFSSEIREKLLGYYVNFDNDSLSLALNQSKWNKSIINESALPTKRQLLQVLMTIFDPLGLYQFITSKLKIIYHKSCKEQIEWDELINEDYRDLWQKSIEWIRQAEKIEIPRCYKSREEVCRSELWCFGDAGTDMLCGLIYVRFLNEKNEQINVQLIYGKTYTVPHKIKSTTPQLELDIAYRIVEMSKVVLKAHTIKFDEINYCTDNQAVLEWIRHGAHKATVYVKHRLSKINAFTRPSQWRKIPSELMPADIGTKIESMTEVKYDNNWFFPKLFRLPESNWPECVTNKIAEVVNSHNSEKCHDLNTHILDATRYSNYRSLISVGMIALKWKTIVECSRLKSEIENLEKETSKNTHDRQLRNRLKDKKADYLQKCVERNDRVLNYKRVEILAIKLAQEQEFSNEIAIVTQKDGQLPQNNMLFNLTPSLDEDGILRVKSRIPLNDKNVKIFGYDRIRPIILPKDHDLTKLIVLKYHMDSRHFLNNAVIVNLMRRFYIPHIKWTVNHIIKRNCYVCKRRKAKPKVPMMGNLPDTRLAYFTAPFTYSIVDLAGPVILKNYRSRDVKRYIFVYSCLTTRAVHLELIEDLSANATLMALQNVINLRGAPRKIISDLGTSFVGANTILNKAQSEWNESLIKRGIIVEPIEWEFGPAKAPHMQGAVERLVGLTKTALSRMTDSLNKSEKKFTDFQLRTILYEITSLLNNRPLSMISINNSNEFLTPNHFLIGRQNVQTVPIVEYKPKCLTEYWKDIKVLSSLLWRHWLSVYVPSIRMRDKWLTRSTPLKKDDVVILADPSIANSWRLGRITEVNVGSEDQVRSVSVKIGKHKPLDINMKKMNRDVIMRLYKEEIRSIVTRPALALAKLDV